MTRETPPIFGKTQFIQGKIDEFMDTISEGLICFEQTKFTY